MFLTKKDMVKKPEKRVKEKLILTGLSNWQDETYIRFHVGDNSVKTLYILDCFLSDLGITYRLFSECLEKKDKPCTYGDFVTNHYFFKTRKYRLHLIFGKKSIHLIIRTPKSRIHEMLSILKNYARPLKKIKIKKN